MHTLQPVQHNIWHELSLLQDFSICTTAVIADSTTLYMHKLSLSADFGAHLLWVPTAAFALTLRLVDPYITCGREGGREGGRKRKKLRDWLISRQWVHDYLTFGPLTRPKNRNSNVKISQRESPGTKLVINMCKIEDKVKILFKCLCLMNEYIPQSIRGALFWQVPPDDGPFSKIHHG